MVKLDEDKAWVIGALRHDQRLAEHALLLNAERLLDSLMAGVPEDCEAAIAVTAPDTLRVVLAVGDAAEEARRAPTVTAVATLPGRPPDPCWAVLRQTITERLSAA